MMNSKKTSRNLVLLGTYRPENEQWILERKLYNLPLPKCGKLAFHERICGVVLFAEGHSTYAFRASFKDVVDAAELEKAGYHRYEISNYAKEDCECRHNLVYWQRGEYVGFGLGAASLLRLPSLPLYEGFHDTRFKNSTDLTTYAETSKRWRKELPMESTKEFDEVEKLGANDCMAEFMFLGLRCMSGIKKSDFRLQFGKQIEHVYGSVLEKYIGSGHLVEENDSIRFTEEGINVSNVILSEFLL